jgi:N-hydroxyarylamine O-acetyltransferase
MRRKPAKTDIAPAQIRHPASFSRKYSNPASDTAPLLPGLPHLLTFLPMAQLDQYLARIGHLGPVKPDLATLIGLHHAQAMSVPYEGIDVYSNIRLDHSLDGIFRKIVDNRRGGWCYESNGLLGWALKNVGFNVMRAAAGVYRSQRGDSAMGNHVVLLVRLDQTYLADLGLGDALRAPIPLAEGTHHQGPHSFRLEKLPGGYWRFHNHALGSPTDFDFRDAPADEALLSHKCSFLQTSATSAFVETFECIAMRPTTSLTILGRVLRHTGLDSVEKRLIASPDEMTTILARDFGITNVSIPPIWPRILARHAQLFSSEDAIPV